MLKINPPNQLKFRDKQKSKNLTLSNQLNQVIIYKIKANNVQVVQARPNCGFIESQSLISLLIRALKNTPFQVKLQINYAVCSGGGTIDSFAEKWDAIDKRDMKQHIIYVQKNQEDDSLFGSMKQIQQQSEKNEQSKSIANQQKSIQQKAKTIQLNDQKIQKQKLLQQRNKNLKLKQELQITTRKLKEVTDNQLQMKINRSIGGICEQHHTSFTTLIIIALFCLVLGFMLGKTG